MSLRSGLARLADALQRAPGVPLSASCLVNRAELLALVEQARADLPVEVREAADLLAQREELLAQARRDAERLVEEGRRHADALVDASAIIARARAQGDELVAAARARARQVRHDADDYCDRRLAGMEIDLDRALAELRRGRERLHERLSGDDAPQVAGDGAASAEGASLAGGLSGEPSEEAGGRVIDLTALDAPGLGTAPDLQ
jgi:cell division septum initiation protein DivIVA